MSYAQKLYMTTAFNSVHILECFQSNKDVFQSYTDQLNGSSRQPLQELKIIIVLINFE